MRFSVTRAQTGAQAPVVTVAMSITRAHPKAWARYVTETSQSEGRELGQSECVLQHTYTVVKGAVEN